MRSIIFCLGGLMLFLQSTAGDNPFPTLRAGAHWGFIIPHHPYMRHYINSHTYGFSLDVDFPANGQKDWHHFFNLPSYGVSIFHQNTGTDTLGNAWCGLMYLDLPLNEKRNIQLKTGVGVGWMTKPYDKETNPKNNAIGSHLNCAIQLQLSYLWQVAENWSLRPGIAITHMSNGAFKMPNLGLNIPTFSLGLEFQPGKSQYKIEREERVFQRGEREIMITGIGGIKEMLPLESPSFMVFNVIGQYNVRISAKSSIGGALDLGYNTGHYPVLQDIGENVGSRWETMRPGVAASWILHFGNVRLAIQLGRYLYTRFNSDGYIFNRYSLQYEVSDKIIVGAGLKSHFARADNVEVGLSYRWSWKKD